MMHTRLKVADEEGNRVDSGVVGEIHIKGPAVTPGYWKDPEATEEARRFGWHHTGDVGVMDADGYITIVDRLKDMIITGGFNVYPNEVEQALTEHPAVLEAAVVAARDENGLEKPKAFIVLKDGKAKDLAVNLQDFVKDRVGKWKYPRWVEFVDDLPKTATGKIQRFKLRDEPT